MLNNIEYIDGKIVAEKLRAAVEANHYGSADQVTCSFGIVEVNCENSNVDMIMETVDSLLYKAKKNGKNRVEGQDSAPREWF